MDITDDFVQRLITSGRISQQKAGLDARMSAPGGAVGRGTAGKVAGAVLGMALRWEWCY
ncbi:MAG: hypothetical protein R3C59_18815 [Planctomycetaceae bacterium]